MFLHTMGLLYFSRLESLVGLGFFFLKALAATGMHWTGAERTAPLNAPSPTESTKQSLKGGRGRRKSKEKGEVGGGLSESLAYLLYNLLKLGWDLSFSLQLQYLVSYSAFLEKKKEMVVK